MTEMDDKYKSLLIINESTDAHVTINFYFNLHIICWVPHASNVIKPSDKLSHSSDKGCKIELIARFEDVKQPKKILLKARQWIEDKLIRITDSLQLVEGSLSPEEKEACLRKVRRDKELGSLDGGCNLCNILRLDMKEVRAMSKEEQDEEIRKAFLRELQIWHRHCDPDGDDDIAREVIMAYDILKDREKRARYNNMADYDSGWLSGKRFKAVFWPECETVGQRLAWIKRMALLGLSVGITVGGILSIVLTAGFSTPLIGASIAGGLNALKETISREAVVDGCDVKKWLLSTGIGYCLAFLPGGAAMGVVMLESAAISVAELIGIRTAIAAGCGVVSSLASDAKKKFVYGEDVTLNQAIGHAACQAVAFASASFAGGAVAKAVLTATQSTQTAAANIEGAIEEQVSSLCDRVKGLAHRIPGPLVKNVTEVAIEKTAEFVEKRLDDSVKNPSSGGDNLNRQDCTPSETEAVLNFTDTSRRIDGIIRYISKGFWFSKMVVSYILNGEEITKEKRGNGSQIKIPSDARRIKVNFKVWRPRWCDVMKYDRFERCWCKPNEPHIFHYDTPLIRTFTISGPLWWEAVMEVIDQHHKETKEM